MEIHDAQWFDRKWLESVSKEEVEAQTQNAVYKACHLFERLEGVGRVRGNGHHMQQDVAAFAKKLIQERWKA